MQISIDTSVSSLIDRSLVNKSIQSSEFYEAAILSDETIVSNYWYLGVSYLLAGREAEAQAAWMVPISTASETELDIYTQDLLAVLEQEAKNRAEIIDLESAWILRQHLWTISPDSIDNILQLILLSNSLKRLTLALLIEWRVDELLDRVTSDEISDELLNDIIGSLLVDPAIFGELILEIIDKCLQLTAKFRGSVVTNLAGKALELFFQKKAELFAIELAEMCQKILPNDLNVIQILAGFYSGIGLHSKAIDQSERYYLIADNNFQRLFSSYLIQKSYLTGGNWEKYLDRIEKHRQLVDDFIVTNEGDNLSYERQKSHLIVTSFFSLYTNDNPQLDRRLQNQISAIYQRNLDPLTIEPEFDRLSLEKKTGILRIGYLASTLRAHSVGWLSRWLFHYHDRTSFQIFNYCLNQNSEDTFNHKWFRDKTDVSYYFNQYQEAVAQIKADEIDILIDLDSLTFDLSCQVMAHKPAPVQATWLGLDASGIPAIDYFIVDPYVLPDNAQDYYQEKLWRLPSTYLAIDGFEVGIPNLSRIDLDIPMDAVIYFSSQGGYKRHPDNIRCQMRIIAAVPNSYLLIKGKSDPEMVRDLFGKIAKEEGANLEQLRFLPAVSDEYTHRANLSIADIVLDTFPYNGATTTLETLWMGIPMVTQVGQQFAARNSYTFMLNAGIEEGIAWNQAEYIEWGIKLGLDRNLRDKVAGKLRAGRATAPVWNAKQFTLDMEQAYREMWAKYQEQQQQDLN
jgi:predicted O-linked N-acetylglucosamine transferase (SPINDLY family)